MSGTPKNIAEMLQQTLDRLGERLESVEEKLTAFQSALETFEERLEDIEAGFKAMRACDECHVLFADNDGYQRHLCRGEQGR